MREKEWTGEQDDHAFLEPTLSTFITMQELEGLLSREGLCVQTEFSLLRLVQDWAASNVGEEEQEDHAYLAKLLNLIHVERRVIASRITK